MVVYARFLVRHAWLVLLAVALATAWIGLGIGKLRTEFNVEASLPANHPFVRDRPDDPPAVRRPQHDHRAHRAARRATSGGRRSSRSCRTATLAALRLADVIAQNVVSLAAPSVRYVEDVDGRIEADS